MSYSPHRRDDRRDRVADPYRGGERARDGAGPPEQICGDYQRSNCFRPNCRFAHILKNGGGAPPPGPGPVRPPSNADLCKDFIKGRCSRGHSCRYIHIANPNVPFDSFPSFGGPVPHPNYAAYAAAAYGAAPFFPPNMGAPFAPGYPSYFGHQMPLPSFPHAPFPPVTPNIELCRDFKHGACSRGEACRFAHIREMCADFLRGKCDRGTECRYSHDKPMSAPCRDYQKGVCTRGSTCRYYHDVAQTCRDYQRGNCERGDACKYIHTARTTTTTETKDGTELTRQSSKEHDTMPGMSRKRTRDEDEVGSAHGDDSHHLNHAHMSRNSSRESTSLHRVDEHEQKNETQPGHHQRHIENGGTDHHLNHHDHDQSEDAHERPPKQIKRVHSSDSQEEEAPRYD